MTWTEIDLVGCPVMISDFSSYAHWQGVAESESGYTVHYYGKLVSHLKSQFQPQGMHAWHQYANFPSIEQANAYIEAIRKNIFELKWDIQEQKVYDLYGYQFEDAPVFNIELEETSDYVLMMQKYEAQKSIQSINYKDNSQALFRAFKGGPAYIGWDQENSNIILLNVLYMNMDEYLLKIKNMLKKPKLMIKDEEFHFKDDLLIVDSGYPSSDIASDNFNREDFPAGAAQALTGKKHFLLKNQQGVLLKLAQHQYNLYHDSYKHEEFSFNWVLLTTD